MKALKKITAGMITFAMAVALFSGAGQIFGIKGEEPVFASVWNDSGNYDGSITSTGEKGSATNPFVLLEIVPGYSLAQAGYLVKGQEPINMASLSALPEGSAKTAAWNALSEWFLKEKGTKAFSGFRSQWTDEEFVALQNNYYEVKVSDYSTRYSEYVKRDSAGGEYKLNDEVVAVPKEGDFVDGRTYYVKYDEVDHLYVKASNFSYKVPSVYFRFNGKPLAGRFVYNSANQTFELSTSTYNGVTFNDGFNRESLEKIREDWYDDLILVVPVAKSDYTWRQACGTHLDIKDTTNSGNRNTPEIGQNFTVYTGKEPVAALVELNGGSNNSGFLRTIDGELYVKANDATLGNHSPETDHEGNSITYYTIEHRYTITHVDDNSGWYDRAYKSLSQSNTIAEGADAATYTGTITLTDEAVSASGEPTVIKALPEDNVPVYSGYHWSFKSKDLFRKYTLGLIYEDNDYTKDEDVTSYEFKGWYYEEECVNPFNSSMPIKSNTVLYAKWTPIYSSSLKNTRYTVNFDPNVADTSELEGTFDFTRSITNVLKNSEVVAPSGTPYRKATDDNWYIFKGWYLDPECTEENKVFFPYTVTGNVTMYAGWEEHSKTTDPTTCTIRFYKNAPAEEVVTGMPAETPHVYRNNRTEAGGSAISGYSDPVREGYVFGGWYWDSASNVRYDFDASIPGAYAYGTINLYAYWIPNNALPIYTVSFDKNEPDVARAEAVGTTPTYTVTYGGRLTAELPNNLSIEGNTDAKLEASNVTVVTVTPADLTAENFSLLKRADMIIISEPVLADRNKNSRLREYFGTYRNTDLFPDVTGRDYASGHDSFTGNDISFETAKYLLCKGAGVDTATYGAVSPILFDYNIVENVVSGTGNTATYIGKLSDGTALSLSNAEKKGFNSNFYKLYLMTQQMNPVTLYNAYLNTESSIANYGIDNSGNFKVTSPSASYSYWNKYTLIPWYTVSPVDYAAYTSVDHLTTGFDLVGVTIDAELPSDYTRSKVNNGILIYNNPDNNSFADSFNNHTVNNGTIATDDNPAMYEAFEGKAAGGVYSVADGLHYLLKSASASTNFHRDLSILELEPTEKYTASGIAPSYKDDAYWFWMIARYIPDYTGKTTVTRMNSSEFIGNIDDVNSKYDVIYIGGDGDGMVTEFMPDAGTSAVFSAGTIDGINATNIITIGEKAGVQEISVPFYVWSENVAPVRQDAAPGYIEIPEHYLNIRYDRGEDRLKANTTEGVDVYLEFTYNIHKTISNDTLVRKSYAWYDLSTMFTALLGTWRVDYDDEYYIYLDNFNKNSYAYRYTDKDGMERTVTLSGDAVQNPSSNSTLQDSSGAGEVQYNPADLFINTYYVLSSSGAWVEKPAGTSVQNGDRIVLKEDAALQLVSGKYPVYVYSHTGRVVNPQKKNDGSNGNRDGNVQYVKKATSGYLLKGNTTTDVVDTAYSGNDLTKVKYDALKRFVDAGYPVIIGNDLLTTDKRVNTAIVDTASYLYKFLSEVMGTTYENRCFYEYTSGVSGRDNFRNALNNKTFSLDLVASPKIYRDKTSPEFSGLSLRDSDIYVNGADIENTTLKYVIRIDGNTSDQYTLNIFIDTNADGRYTEETEKVDSAEIVEVRARGNETARLSDPEYYVKVNQANTIRSTRLRAGKTYLVSVYTKGIVGALPWKLTVVSNSRSVITDEVVGLSAIKTNEKAKALALQILPFENNKNDYTESVVFPDNTEVAAAEGNGGVLRNVTGNKVHTSDAVYKTAQKIYNYMKDLNEFEVEFFKLKTSEFESFIQGRNAAIAAGTVTKNDPYWESVSGKDEIGYVDNVLVCRTRSGDIAEINMLILGFADTYGGAEKSSGAVELSDDACHAINDYVSSGKATLFTHDTTSYYATAQNTTGNKKAYSMSTNKYFRETLRMDRYDVLKYGSNTEYNWEYDRIYSEAEDWPFKTGGTQSLARSNMAVSRIWLNGRYLPNDDALLLQGFTNTCIYQQVGSTRTNRATKTNEGQLTEYPYYIPDVLSVAETHTQYWQLDLEDDDVVVWYSLGYGTIGSDIAKSCYQTVNDVRNNYYIYNAGNITYTGVGHSYNKELTNDEAKLFVNTMVAAYRTVGSAAKPLVLNTDKGTLGESREYVYVDYDGTVDNGEPMDPLVYEVSENNYVKRIYFSVRSNSIVFNKSMTVHFYPVYNGKVYNEFPMDLTVTECDSDYPDDESLWEDPETTDFTYVFADSNGTNVKANFEGYVVSAGRMYFVDIPISDEYYRQLFANGPISSIERVDGLPYTQCTFPDITFDTEINGESGTVTTTVDKAFALDSNSSFTVRIDILMRYGKDQSRNNALSDCVDVVFTRRNLFTLD